MTLVVLRVRGRSAGDLLHLPGQARLWEGLQGEGGWREVLHFIPFPAGPEDLQCVRMFDQWRVLHAGGRTCRLWERLQSMRCLTLPTDLDVFRSCWTFAGDVPRQWRGSWWGSRAPSSTRTASPAWSDTTRTADGKFNKCWPRLVRWAWWEFLSTLTRTTTSTAGSTLRSKTWSALCL